MFEIAILFIVVVVVVLIFVTPNQKKNTNKEHKYIKRKALFTPAENPSEISFTKSLNKIVANQNQKKNTSKEYKYKKCGSLFSPAEINFKKSLDKIVVNPNLVVYGKVRMADIITPDINKKSNYKKWFGAFTKIKSKHVDYVICDKRNYCVLCVIELDDSSHNSAKARTRDCFVNQAYKSAGIEILRVKAARDYLLEELLDLFSDDMQRQLSQEK